jgi:hypothetical protein
MANRLAQEVLATLAEPLGDFIARAVMKRNCERLGIDPESLAPKDLDELSGVFEKSLAVFADPETAKVVAEKVRSMGGY